MRKLLGLALVVGLLLAIPASAQVNMYYNGPQGGSLGGIYTYPYGFTINGDNNGGNFWPLLCDTFNRNVNPGDQWSAYTLNMANLNGTTLSALFYPSAGISGYMAAAYLFKEQIANPSNGEYNWAVWYLLDPSDVTGSSYWASLTGSQQTDIENLASGAESAVAGDTPSDFAGVIIYTPTDGTGQEFFGIDSPQQAPEPSTLALLGSGILGIAGVIRRKAKA